MVKVEAGRILQTGSRLLLILDHTLTLDRIYRGQVSFAIYLLFWNFRLENNIMLFQRDLEEQNLSCGWKLKPGFGIASLRVVYAHQILYWSGDISGSSFLMYIMPALLLNWTSMWDLKYYFLFHLWQLFLLMSHKGLIQSVRLTKEVSCTADTPQSLIPSVLLCWINGEWGLQMLFWICSGSPTQ